jgi:hypothetical protein
VLEELLGERLAAEQVADPHRETAAAQVDDLRHELLHRRARDAQDEVEKEEPDEHVERGKPADIRHGSTLTHPGEAFKSGHTLAGALTHALESGTDSGDSSEWKDPGRVNASTASLRRVNSRKIL